MAEVFNSKNPAKQPQDVYSQAMSSNRLVSLSVAHVKHIDAYDEYKKWVLRHFAMGHQFGNPVIKTAWTMIQNGRKQGVF